MHGERGRELDEALDGGSFDVRHRGEECARRIARVDGAPRPQAERRPPAGDREPRAVPDMLVAGDGGDAGVGRVDDVAAVDLLDRLARRRLAQAVADRFRQHAAVVDLGGEGVDLLGGLDAVVAATGGGGDRERRHHHAAQEGRQCVPLHAAST